MARAKSKGSKDSTANLGFEAKLWLAADKLRNSMEAAGCKEVVFGLIFLKYTSETFRRDLHPDLSADTATRVSAKPKSQSHLTRILRSEGQHLAKPPVSDSDLFRDYDVVRWPFGVLPKCNASFAWVEHLIHHFAPHRMASANGSMTNYR